MITPGSADLRRRVTHIPTNRQGVLEGWNAMGQAYVLFPGETAAEVVLVRDLSWLS